MYNLKTAYTVQIYLSHFCISVNKSPYPVHYCDNKLMHASLYTIYHSNFSPSWNEKRKTRGQKSKVCVYSKYNCTYFLTYKQNIAHSLLLLHLLCDTQNVIFSSDGDALMHT